MARKTKVIVVCDLHDSDVEAVDTVRLGIGDEQRSLDLCAEHLAEVRAAMAPWLAAVAGRAGSRRGGAPKRPRPFRNPDAAEVRAWALANGYDLPARGRIPTAVREAFAAR